MSLFLKKNDENYNRVFIKSFEAIDTIYLKNLILFPKQKRIKEIDILIFSPHKLGLSFMISEKLYNIITKFKLPPFNKIPAQINTFNTKYFLIGFPMIPKESIDLGKSIFFDTKKEVNLISNHMMNSSKRITLLYLKKYTQMYFMMSMLSVFRAKGYFFLTDCLMQYKMPGL